MTCFLTAGREYIYLQQQVYYTTNTSAHSVKQRGYNYSHSRNSGGANLRAREVHIIYEAPRPMGRTKTRGHRLAGNNPRGVAAGSLSRRHALKALLRVHLMSHAPRRSSALALCECSPCTETQPTSLAPSLRCGGDPRLYTIMCTFMPCLMVHVPCTCRARAQSQRGVSPEPDFSFWGFIFRLDLKFFARS